MSSSKLLTIEIGERNIRVCEVGYGRPVVYRAVSFATPEATMYDGYIVAIDKLAEYLKLKLKEAGIFRKDVIFSISSSRILSKETEIPYVKDKLVRKVALARADEYFPTKLEDYVISTLLLTKSKKANKMRVNLFAAPRDLIAGYFHLASKLGIRVESVDYVGNAIHQWLNRKLKKETALVVNIGYYISIASIMDEGRMRMQRNIATGIDRFVQIKEALAMGENIDEILAESELELLTESMLGMLEHYNTHQMGKPISKVYVVGEGAYLDSLSERFETVLEIPTVLMKQAFGAMLGRSRTNMSKGNVESFYIACMGAGISPAGMVFDEVRIAEERREEIRRLREKITKLIVLFLFVLVLCRINFIEARNQNLRLKAEINNKKYALEMHDNYNKNKQEYEYLAKLDTATEINNDRLLILLMELESKLPQGTNISSFIYDNQGISLTVNAIDKKNAAKFIMQMRDLEYLENIEVSEIKYNAERKNYTMKMSCKYKEQKEQELNE